MTSLSNFSYSKKYEPFLDINFIGRDNSNFSRGSMTVGDYQDKFFPLSTSYLIDPNYKFLSCKSSNYKGLQELISSWMNESNDYDVREWPEIEKELNDHRLKFPHDI